MSEPAFISDDEFATGLSIFDTENPYSLISLVDSQKLKEAFARIQKDCSKMLLSPEIEIERWSKPTDLIARLRLAFWDEYERAMQTKTPLRVLGFVRQHCDIAYFYEVVIKNNGYLCYIITPPRKYELTMRQILDKANRRLLEIVDLPLYDKRGKLDRLALQAILKIQQIADVRVKGAVTQRLQIQQHVLNQTMSPEDQYYEKLSLKELDELQKQIDTNRQEKKIMIEGEVEKQD